MADMNTVYGWVLAGGIAALGLSIASGMYYHGDGAERPENMGYEIEGVVSTGGEDAGPDLGTLLAAGDAAAGEAVFAKCVACHTINQGGANGIGPNLYGAMGSTIGAHAPGFAYSDALKSVGGSWTFENMSEWLLSPRRFASGTKMSFAGLSDPQDRANVMLYLNANTNSPLPLPEPQAPEAESATDDGDVVEGEAVPEGVLSNEPDDTETTEDTALPVPGAN